MQRYSFGCRLDPSLRLRWMLDPGACSRMRAVAVPVVSLPALATLAALLSVQNSAARQREEPLDREGPRLSVS